MIYLCLFFITTIVLTNASRLALYANTPRHSNVKIWDMLLFFNNYYKMIVYNTEIFCVPFIGFPQWCHPQLYSIISLPSIGSDKGRYRTFSSPPESFTSPFYSNFIVIYTHSLLIKCQPPPCSSFCVCHFNNLCINGTIYHASF